MTVLEDIGRFLGFAVLISLLFFLEARILVAAMKRSREKRAAAVQLLGLLASAVIWAGLFVAIWPITGVLSLPLLLTGLSVAVTSRVLGSVMGMLLRVRSDEKSSVVTARELVSVRHPWVMRLGARVAQMGAILIIALLVEGLLVLVLDDGNRETTMFRLTFGTMFFTYVPTAIVTAFLMLMPVLDDNSREGLLAAGITAMITQLLALSLLLSSLDMSHRHFALGLSNTSLPVFGVPLLYFILSTALPYSLGLRASRRLRDRFTAEEESIKERLEGVLVVPRTQLYDGALEELKGGVDAQVETLREDYFYLNLRSEAPAATADAVAGAIETGRLSIEAGAVEKRPSEAGEVLPADARALRSELQQPLGQFAVARAPAEASTQPGETIENGDENPTYGELVTSVADHLGWSASDPRRAALENLIDSFETQARYSDPSFIHCSWLERVSRLIEEIRRDLAHRRSGSARETAALSWSRVAALQKLELTPSTAGTRRTPRALVAITTLAGLVMTALIETTVSGVWHAFIHAAP